MSRISNIFKVLSELVVLSVLLGCQNEPDSSKSVQIVIASRDEKTISVKPQSIFAPELPAKSIETVLQNVAVNRNSQLKTFGTSSPIVCGNIFITVYPAVRGPSNTTLVPVVSFLSRNYQWQLESTTHLESGQLLESVLGSQLKSQGLQTLMSRSSYLISVGTASREGSATREDERALDRSRSIDDVIRRNLPSENILPKLYLLNLGKYDSKCTQTSNTRFERPVLVITILIEKEGEILSVGSAISAGLSKNIIKKLIQDKISLDPPADLKLACYPRFELSE